MKILFLVFHGFYGHNGISKKIYAQVQALRNLGHDTRICFYDVLENGERVWKVDGEVIASLGRGVPAKIRKRLDMSAVSDYAIRNGMDLLYYRSFHNASPVTVAFTRKLKNAGMMIAYEIPTWPYDGEYPKPTVKYLMDKMFRKQLCRNVDKIVTFSDEKVILGRPAICISNGIDFNTLPLHRQSLHEEGTLNMIAVAEIHFWHGFDRIIHGMGLYGGDCRLHLDVVGEFWGEREEKEIMGRVKEFNLENSVTFHGAKFGEELDALFDNADLAIGSLGRHRSGIDSIKTLKNREYAARGFRFIYSETDSDFDDAPFVFKVPADESPVDMEAVVEFATRCTMEASEIRKKTKHLSWDAQMLEVIDSL